MAKYTVTYADGVTGEVQLFGPGKERQRKLEWLSKQLSPKGYRKQQDELRAKGELKSKMKTIIRVIPGQNPETLIPALEKDLDKAKGEYSRQKEVFESLVKPGWSEDERKAWYEGHLSYGDNNSSSLLTYLNKAEYEVNRIQNNIDEAKKKGVVNPVVEFVAINSFENKDKLKSSGYRYDSSGYWVDPVGRKTMPAWIKRIEVKPGNEEKLGQEVILVKSLGEVEGDNILNRMTAGDREGIITSQSEKKQPDSGLPAKLPEPPKSEPPAKAEPKPEAKQEPASTETKLDQIERQILEKRQADRTHLSQASDKSRRHSIIVSPEDPKVRTWMKDPGSMDVFGIDTPKGVKMPIAVTVKTRTPRISKRVPRITPKRARITDLGAGVIRDRRGQHLRLS